MDCLFCGIKFNKSNKSEEDVIPKWLQRYFNLWQQSYVLPGGGKLKYQNLKVPACRVCNNTWSRLEKRISNKKASLDDYYLWALKIHLGLIYKDSFLRKNKKEFKSPKIFSYKKHKDYFLFPRKIFEILRFKTYNFHPSPLGSVILIDKPRIFEKQFELIHPLFPPCPKLICISLKDKYLVVFFEDRNFIMNTLDRKKINNIKKIKDPLQLMIKLRDFLANTAYELYRFSLPPLKILIIENNIIVPGIFYAPKQSEFNFKELKSFGHIMGIEIEQMGKGKRKCSLSSAFVRLVKKD